MDSATAQRITPLREPEDGRSWEERQLTRILIRVADAATSPGYTMRDIAQYVLAAMDWFVATCGEPDPRMPADPFEEWLIARWLKEVRSEAFQNSADAQYLMAEWERGR